MVRALKHLALACALLAATAHAEGAQTARARAEVLPFAYALMSEGDYYRAIGELKRFVYLAPDAPEAFPAMLSIGRAYELGGKAADGASWIRRLQAVANTPQLRADMAVELGYAQYLAGDTGAAIEQLSDALHAPDLSRGLSSPQRARAQYLLGWAYLFHGQGEAAAQQFADVPLADARTLADAARGYANTPRKSPLLAGALSAVVPGLGHLYLGMPGIALAAFAWNALFIAATYDAFHHHLYGVGAVLTGLDLLWYGGAVFGAVSGAEKYNRDAQLNYLDDLRSRYDVAPLSWPPSPVR